MFFRTIQQFKTILFLVNYLLIVQPAIGQETGNYSREEFIRDFHGASLLVRLQDKAITIKELEERGLEEKADKVRREQARENREILLSFKQTFDFCPVYFFYASDSEAIRQGKYQGNVFDRDLQPALPKTKKTFIGEFSETEELGIDGFIVKDQKMIALPENLPYFERKFILMGLIERSKARMIEAYNHKLNEYWEMYSN